MSSKHDILAAIRAHQPPPAALPSLESEWIRYADPLEQFGAVLQSVGGRCERVGDEAEIAERLSTLEAWRAARQICSIDAGIVRGNVELAEVDGPHALESVDFAVLRGEFAVAENAAVWVTDRGVSHRAVYFIAQHLALVVRAGEIVHNMHEAYQRLSFRGRGFGAFISGPSKTADIEQSLVIGAHGPRSLTVFLVGG